MFPIKPWQQIHIVNQTYISTYISIFKSISITYLKMTAQLSTIHWNKPQWTSRHTHVHAIANIRCVLLYFWYALIYLELTCLAFCAFITSFTAAGVRINPIHAGAMDTGTSSTFVGIWNKNTVPSFKVTFHLAYIYSPDIVHPQSLIDVESRIVP